MSQFDTGFGQRWPAGTTDTARCEVSAPRRRRRRSAVKLDWEIGQQKKQAHDDSNLNSKSRVRAVTPTLVIDANLRRVVRHVEPVRGDRPELSDAERILAEEAARREAIFAKSFEDEKTRDDALSKRFEEALRQAGKEPITKPMRDFDFD